MPFIVDLDALEARRGELAGEAAELLGELHIGLEPRRFLGRERRHVERVGHRAGGEIVGHLLGDLQRDILLRLGRRRAEMRRRHHVVAAEEGVLLGRLDREDIERRAARPGPQSSAAFRSSSTMSPPRAQLMMRTPFFVLASALASMRWRVASVSGVCKVMKSARASSSSSSTFSTPSVDRAFGREEGIVGHHLHLEADGAVGDDRADIAAADDAERLAGELDAHEARLFPFARLGRAVGSGKLARQREHQGDGVLGGGDASCRRACSSRRCRAASRPARRHCRRRCRRGRSPSGSRPARAALGSPWWPSGWRGRHTCR